MHIEVLSPFPVESLPRIWKWIEPFRSKVSDDFGPKTIAEFVESATVKCSHQKTWAIYVESELGGLITFQKLNPWLGTAHWIFKPDFQGRGIAVRASRIAVAEMFALGIGKLAIYPLAGNLAMGSLLMQLGAKREGTLFEQTLSDGKPIDMWVYGITKSAFEGKQHHALGSTHSSSDRSGVVDLRVSPLGTVADVDHHADALAGVTTASVTAP